MSGTAPPPPPAPPPRSGPAARRLLIAMGLVLGLAAMIAYAASVFVPDPTTTGTPQTTSGPTGPGEPTDQPSATPDADPCRAVPAKVVQRVVSGATPVRTPPGTFLASCLWVGRAPDKSGQYRSLRVQFHPFYAKGPKEALEELKRGAYRSSGTPPSVSGRTPGSFEAKAQGALVSQVVTATNLGEEETVEVRILGYNMVPGVHGTFKRAGADADGLVRQAWQVADGVRTLDQDSMDPSAKVGRSRYKTVGKQPANVCKLLPAADIRRLVGPENDLITLPDAGICTWRTEPAAEPGRLDAELDVRLKHNDDADTAHTSLSAVIDGEIGVGGNLSTVVSKKPLDELGEPKESFLLTGAGRIHSTVKSDYGASVIVLRRANVTLTVRYVARKHSGDLLVPGRPLPATVTDRAVQDVAKKLLGAL